MDKAKRSEGGTSRSRKEWMMRIAAAVSFVVMAGSLLAVADAEDIGLFVTAGAAGICAIAFYGLAVAAAHSNCSNCARSRVPQLLVGAGALSILAGNLLRETVVNASEFLSGFGLALLVVGAVAMVIHRRNAAQD